MKVSLFITCLSDVIYPRVGESMVRLLSKFGVPLHFPTIQTCCGQPAYNSGYWDEARATAKTILDAFDDSDFVISPSGSCTYMIHHYPELFKEDPINLERAQRLEKKTYEYTQFLVDVLKLNKIDAYFPHKVTFHSSCHGGRLLGVKNQPLKILSDIRGLEFVPLPFVEDCCGFGGTFAAKMADISGAMVIEKVDHILETEAEVLVGMDMACLMNIAGNLRHRNEPVRVMHIAELLEEGVFANENN